MGEFSFNSKLCTEIALSFPKLGWGISGLPGHIRLRKSFALALPSQLQVGLKLQYTYGNLIFKLIIFYSLPMMLYTNGP